MDGSQVPAASMSPAVCFIWSGLEKKKNRQIIFLRSAISALQSISQKLITFLKGWNSKGGWKHIPKQWFSTFEAWRPTKQLLNFFGLIQLLLDVFVTDNSWLIYSKRNMKRLAAHQKNSVAHRLTASEDYIFTCVKTVL